MLEFYRNLSKHYDKLLHALVTFVLVIWLDKAISVYAACLIVFVLQCCKVFSNWQRNWEYRMLGDWLANGGGCVLVVLWYI